MDGRLREKATWSRQVGRVWKPREMKCPSRSGAGRHLIRKRHHKPRKWQLVFGAGRAKVTLLVNVRSAFARVWYFSRLFGAAGATM